MYDLICLLSLAFFFAFIIRLPIRQFVVEDGCLDLYLFWCENAIRAWCDASLSLCCLLQKMFHV